MKRDFIPNCPAADRLGCYLLRCMSLTFRNVRYESVFGSEADITGRAPRPPQRLAGFTRSC
jgi:hypothetical protein